MDICYRKAINKEDRWFHYLLPKKITLDCHPPIFKWLCFVYHLDKEEYQEWLFKHKKQSTFIYCPECDMELISGGLLLSDNKDGVAYKCNNCYTISLWDFDLPCGPVILRYKNKKGEWKDYVNS